MTLTARMRRINDVIPIAKYVFIFLVGIIYALFDHIGKVSPAFNEGLIVTLLLVITSEVVRSGLNEDSGKDKASAESEPFGPLECETLTDVWRTVKKDITMSMHVHESGFSVVNPELPLAVKSYFAFWERMVRAQQTSRKGTSLHVRAIHSSEMDVWDDKLLSKQKQFSEAGGRVTRILCGYGSQPDATVAMISDAMKRSLVDVRYYDISSQLVDHTFDWDFLHVARTNEAVIWIQSATKPRKIRKAIFTSKREYEGKRLEDLWQDIHDQSANI